MGSKKTSKAGSPSRESRGLNKIPNISKKHWRLFRRCESLPSADALLARQMKVYEQKGSKQLIKKWQIENILTRQAMEMYHKNEGKVLWSQVVHALKTNTNLELGNKVYKISRNERTNFEIKIKTSEVEKFNYVLKA